MRERWQGSVVRTRDALGEPTHHNGFMRLEYRLDDEGKLLSPEVPEQAQAYDAATRRWLVATLPRDSREWRTAQLDVLDEIGIHTESSVAQRHLADASLHPNLGIVIPDDVVAMRVAFVRLSEGAEPAVCPVVNVVSRLGRAVTTSADEKTLRRLVERVGALPPTRRRGTFVIVRALLSLALEDAVTFSDVLTTRVADLESDVFSDADADAVTDIYRCKRAIAEARRQLMPIVNRIALVVEVDDAELGADAVDHLERIGAAFRRVVDSLENDDRLLGDMLTAQLTLVQVQQNTDMRRISAYAALAAVPTFVAGIYGLNFDVMPELHWQFGYPLILAAMTGLVMGLRQLFKRSGWL